MPFFFFGTLMDREVLATVLDRPVAADELRCAWLEGYRRVCTAHAPYPTLVPRPAGVVDGRLLLRPSPRDAVRIRHYEDEEYVDRVLPVRVAGADAAGDAVAGDDVVAARVFVALETMGQLDRPWDLGPWARVHKARYLEQCREWMRDCPV